MGLNHQLGPRGGVGRLVLLLQQRVQLWIAVIGKVAAAITAIGAGEDGAQVAARIGEVRSPHLHDDVVIPGFAKTERVEFLAGDFLDVQRDPNRFGGRLERDGSVQANRIAVGRDRRGEATLGTRGGQERFGFLEVIGCFGQRFVGGRPSGFLLNPQRWVDGCVLGKIARVFDNRIEEFLLVKGVRQRLAHLRVAKRFATGVEGDEVHQEAWLQNQIDVAVAAHDRQQVQRHADQQVDLAGFQARDLRRGFWNDFVNDLVQVRPARFGVPVFVVALDDDFLPWRPRGELEGPGRHHAAVGLAEGFAFGERVRFFDDARAGRRADVLPQRIGFGERDFDGAAVHFRDAFDALIHPTDVRSGFGVFDALHAEQHVVNRHRGTVPEGHVFSDFIDVRQRIRVADALGDVRHDFIVRVETLQTLDELLHDRTGVEVVIESGIQRNDIAGQRDGERAAFLRPLLRDAHL